jgi:hypothetical protein
MGKAEGGFIGVGRWVEEKLKSSRREAKDDFGK